MRVKPRGAAAGDRSRADVVGVSARTERSRGGGSWVAFAFEARSFGGAGHRSIEDAESNRLASRRHGAWAGQQGLPPASALVGVLAPEERDGVMKLKRRRSDGRALRRGGGRRSLLGLLLVESVLGPVAGLLDALGGLVGPVLDALAGLVGP